ncbi:uncharacterized protein DUF4377 [Chitinophaga skermanii]|uniref:Uncharacterized protein DUF4377 n=1 Tax=Chitinophaga skermanii TaxID=331697 RepID=A0A327QBZ5_9BACT|nr:DUF4377 domain-containing protein [Chitinophaga skermanii]RAJ01495.1 uncharacterized protein DUF4377 [Chitinophaga skermanii]
MKTTILLAAAVLTGFSACQNANKASTADSTAITPATTSTVTPIEGYYEASLAAASSPGRTIGLELEPGGQATMLTDYHNQTPEIVDKGDWKKEDSTAIIVTTVTVGSGNSTKDTLRFKKDGNSLIYTGNAYGSDGLVLTAKDKPAPVDKELIVWVDDEVECKGGMGEKLKCFYVVYGDKFMNPGKGKFETLSAPINGFKYEKGNRYKLRVNRKLRNPAPADASMYEYDLIEQVEKTKK